MATTTNFGWETPDDTDLVKDGALAIRTLGSAIDTSLVDLKGGTTGQVLSKTSNTDMDFTWVTSDDANAIQNAIVDAKGDLIAASAADTPARLAVGNNGETLVADSSATTGLRWTSANQQQPVINSAFDVWQRGTSFAIPAAYTFTADRFEAIRGGGALGMTVSRQSTNDTTNLPQIRYAARIARDSGNTSTAAMYLDHSIETADSIRYTGQTITISLYARVGANYSPTSNAFKVKGVNGTGTDQAIKNYTGANLFINSTINPTTTWARYTVSGTVPTNSTEIGIEFEINPTGTAGANDWVEITGIQIDLGSIALPYRRYSATLAGELAAAGRYYQRISNDGGNAYSFLTNYGMATTTGKVRVNYPLKVPMRIAPTALDYSTLAITNDDGNVYSVSSATLDNTTTSNIASIAANTGSTITQYRPYFIGANNSASAYIGFSAEL